MGKFTFYLMILMYYVLYHHKFMGNRSHIPLNSIDTTEIHTSGIEICISGIELCISGNEICISGTEIFISGIEICIGGIEITI